jgi:AcrR family transcriptional regulator
VSKGEETRERILESAYRLASRDGLEGLSIGALATEIGLSKSGLFAHFGSKEDLQVAVIDAAARRFEETVVRPAFEAPRGRPRLERWFERWLAWFADPKAAGGCLFVAAGVELDDREGRPRSALVGHQRRLMKSISKAVQLAVSCGHFEAGVDGDQFAFEMYGILLGLSHAQRLLRDPRAEERARVAFTRLLDACAVRS